MKSTVHSAHPSAGRLVCSRCGLAADPGGPDWRALTAVSHSGSSVAAERAGHEVALDLCRGCMRATLRAALGIRPPATARAGATAARAEAPAPPPPRFDTVCSLADAEAFISRCCARLDAMRREEAFDAGDGANDAWAPRLKAVD